MYEVKYKAKKSDVFQKVGMYNKKTEAQKAAKRIRKKGYMARVCEMSKKKERKLSGKGFGKDIKNKLKNILG